MEAGYSGAMGSDEKDSKKTDEAEERTSEKKKLNDDLAVFMHKCSESDVPRYHAMMKNYVKLQQKRRRADAARKRSEHAQGNQARKKTENEQKEKTSDSCVRQGCDEEHRRRGTGEKMQHRSGSFLGHRSQEPVDCGCRRRRRRSRRRRSCRRRRRLSCRRRRRRSRGRRRRRRSCRRRRRRRRRCR